MTMRALILAYDGLDHDLVEELSLQNILQREHGRVDVPIVGGIDDPSTPIVWTSFITGEPPEVHGVDMPQMWDNRLDGIRSFVRRHGGIHGVLKRFRVGYRVREAIDVKLSFPSRKDIKVDTFFDVIKPSVALGVPVYNKNLEEIYPIGDVLRVRQDPDYLPMFEERVRSIFADEVERLFDAFEEEWRLLMTHFHITDLFGHAFWGTEKLVTLYEEMDLLTKRVKEKIRDDDLVLIVSDHGMSKLGHTKKGFYSFNVRLGLDEPDIKDFFKIVTGLLAED